MTIDPSPSILIVSTKADIATDYVVLKLSARNASFARINTEDFPLGSSSAIYIENEEQALKRSWNTPARIRIKLDDVRYVWYRRHRLPLLPDEISDAHREYCLRESDWFLRGMLYSIDANWMSPPVSIQLADSKIYQLKVAQSVGFRIPDSLISNNPEEIRRFFNAKLGNVIAKPLRLGYFDYGDRQTSVFTNQIRQDDLNDIHSLQIAPVIYQELIQKKFDIRVTIVGQQVFSVAIDSQRIPSARIDWRQTDTEDLRHFIHLLPPEIEHGCLKLLKKLGLNFGAIDLILTPEGDYVFLEINPNGQWVWIEDRLDLPISDTIATWLIGKNT